MAFITTGAADKITNVSFIICYQQFADKLRNPTIFFLKTQTPLLCLMLEGVSCVSVCLCSVCRDLHPWPKGVCACVWGYVAIHSSSRTMVTTNAFFLTTLAPLSSANHERETPPSWPMVRLFTCSQKAGAMIKHSGQWSERDEKGRHERGKRPLRVERVYGCTQALSISGLRWIDIRRSQIVLNTLVSHPNYEFMSWIYIWLHTC